MTKEARRLVRQFRALVEEGKRSLPVRIELPLIHRAALRNTERQLGSRAKATTGNAGKAIATAVRLR
ncbi:MAG: hypothetical protein INF16_04810 [Methylobacterium sp.]|jgi:predicted hydrocarbon binding protein|nr:hypothetical protein [Methylobacterium sp.]